MKSWLRAATLLLAGGSVLAHPLIHRDERDIETVAGSTGPDDVSIQFTTPCKACVADTDTEIKLNLQIQHSNEECDPSRVSLNGLNLVADAQRQHQEGTLVFASETVGQLSDVNITALWTLTCIDKEASLLSIKFNETSDESSDVESSGFAVSFMQQDEPVILRLRNQPARDASLREVQDEWANVRPWSQLVVVPASLESELHELEEIKREMGRLYRHYRHQESKIVKMIKHDFQACDGVKCMFQTAMKKAPDAFELFTAHFRRHAKHHPREGPKELPMFMGKEGPDGQGDIEKMYSSDEMITALGDIEQPKEAEASSLPPPPSEPEPAHHRPEHHRPPFDGPRPPPGKHHGPPFDDDFPHPPPRHHDPPSDGKLPPPEHHAPPSDDRHPPGPPEHFPPHHGPPFGDHHPHGPPPHGGPPHSPPPHGHHPAPWSHSPHPHFPHHGPRHHKPLILSLGSLLLLLLVIGAARKFIKCRIDKTRCQRRRQTRRARCEERRTRVAYRCAAAQHRWSRWWSQFRQPESTDDYDEKRERILSQETHLEDVMQNEIRDLRRAHELVGELMRAEEGRQRMYHEANFGTPAHQHHSQPYEMGESSSAGIDDMDTPSLPAYQQPPPSYEAELEGEMTVVDGFRYTPSNTESTPDSSVVDCNSRISFETGGSAGGLKDF